jgi:FixJ family two-component response regulator
MSELRESGPAPHAGRPTRPLALTAEQRAAVEAALRPATAEQRVVRRARAVLLMAEGYTAAQVALRVGVHARTVEKWRARFDRADPAARLADAPRSGRPRSFVRAA